MKSSLAKYLMKSGKGLSKAAKQDYAQMAEYIAANPKKLTQAKKAGLIGGAAAAGGFTGAALNSGDEEEPKKKRPYAKD